MSYFASNYTPVSFKPYSLDIPQTWKCFYCGSENTGSECKSCNAPKREKTLAVVWGVSPRKESQLWCSMGVEKPGILVQSWNNVVEFLCDAVNGIVKVLIG